MHCTVVIAAAGVGSRIGADKLRLELCGRPVLLRTLAAVRASGIATQVVVGVRPGSEGEARSLLGDDAAQIVSGGAERTETVARALAAVDGGADVVLIHDGARPLASPALFRRVAEAVEPGAGAVAALRVRDTLHREVDGYLAETVDRSELWSAQTPQGFDRAALAEAYRWAAASGRSFTDDAGLFTAWGGKVRLVDGEPTNLKLTFPEDMVLAESYLRREQRVGYGWDVHRLAPGRRLVLGGVELTRPDGLGLLGHSDADVLAHAIADAVLGAAAAGDIGRHFPPDDPAYDGADSLGLLARAVEICRAAGWRVVNVDATVIAEAPRIGPHSLEMAVRLGAALGIPSERVGIKATTSEGLDERGISAHAVALLERAV